MKNEIAIKLNDRKLRTYLNNMLQITMEQYQQRYQQDELDSYDRMYFLGVIHTYKAVALKFGYKDIAANIDNEWKGTKN